MKCQGACQVGVIGVSCCMTCLDMQMTGQLTVHDSWCLTPPVSEVLSCTVMRGVRRCQQRTFLTQQGRRPESCHWACHAVSWTCLQVIGADSGGMQVSSACQALLSRYQSSESFH